MADSYYAARSRRDPAWRERQLREASERERRRREADLDWTPSETTSPTFSPLGSRSRISWERAAGLFLGTLYNPRGPLEFQFLAFTRALESLHRRLVGGQYVSDEDYAAVEAEPFTRGLVQAHASLTICDDLTCVFPNRVDQTVRLRKTRG